MIGRLDLQKPHTRRNARARWIHIVLAGSIAGGIAPTSNAGNVSFTNGDTSKPASWSSSANWSPARIPTAGDTALIPAIAGLSAVNFDYDYTANGAVAAPDGLTINGTSSSTATLSQALGNLVTGIGTVGTSGLAALTQSGGNATFKSLSLGTLSGGQGTVTVGANAMATIAGSGSTGLLVGAATGSTGFLNLTGLLDVSSVPVHVGYSGNGTMTVQTQGTQLAQSLSVGTNTGSTGLLTFTSGGLGSATDITVGASGHGTFNQTGGNLLIFGKLNIAVNAGSSGVYTMSGGTIASSGMANNGSFTQTVGQSNLAAVTGTGAFNIGGGSAAATVNVASFTQGPVTVSNLGQLVVAQNTTRVTNNATSLVVNSGGSVDIGNGNLLVGRTTNQVTQIQSYLASGYASQAWTGSGIVSSAAASDFASHGSAATGTIGWADGADGSSGAAASVGLPANQILVKYTLKGDTNLDGVVNIFDFARVRGNQGQPLNKWTAGDVNYDGVVNIFDFAIVRGNQGKVVSPAIAGSGTITTLATDSPAGVMSVTNGASMNVVTKFTAAIVAGTAMAASSTVAAPITVTSATVSDTDLRLQIDKNTGDAKLIFSNGANIAGYEIDSNTLANPTHHLVPANWTSIASTSPGSGLSEGPHTADVIEETAGGKHHLHVQWGVRHRKHL